MNCLWSSVAGGVAGVTKMVGSIITGTELEVDGEKMENWSTMVLVVGELKRVLLLNGVVVIVRFR